MSSPDIGEIGERYVVTRLRNNGWNIVQWDTRAPGSTDIEATKESRHILVQVKTAVYPNEPDNLTTDEVRNLKSRASRMGAEALEAKVQLTDVYTLSRDISWRKL